MATDGRMGLRVKDLTHEINVTGNKKKVVATKRTEKNRVIKS